MPEQDNRVERSLLWRDIFLFWWPVTARVVGIVGAFVSLVEAWVTHQPVNAAWLTFCGTLVVAPAIFDSQDRANYRRVMDHKEAVDSEASAAGLEQGGSSSSTTHSSSSSAAGPSEPGSPSPSTSERDEG